MEKQDNLDDCKKMIHILSEMINNCKDEQRRKILIKTKNNLQKKIESQLPNE